MARDGEANNGKYRSCGWGKEVSRGAGRSDMGVEVMESACQLGFGGLPVRSGSHATSGAADKVMEFIEKARREDRPGGGPLGSWEEPWPGERIGGREGLRRSPRFATIGWTNAMQTLRWRRRGAGRRGEGMNEEE